MGGSPADLNKKEDATTSSRNSPQAAKAPSPVPQPEVDVAITKPEPATDNADAAFAPPARPNVTEADKNDYLGASAIPSHLSFEPNPFESSFANGAETPGGNKLPSVAALTSPASLLPGGGTTPFSWGNSSLRTGPLSPAMLSGPTTDYFGDTHHLRTGFTPNESSLRTGLTPGGGGSMFPQPSPGTQNLYNMASGAATPSTMDFHRTAINAAQRRANDGSAVPGSVTSQPQERMSNGVEHTQANTEAFAQHDANDAANGLFMLAQSQTRNGNQGVSQYQIAPQQAVHGHPAPPQQQDPRRHQPNGSMGSGRDVSEASAQSDESNEQQNRPNTRNKGKKPIVSNGRTRKAEEAAPAKPPGAKKGKNNNGNVISYMEPEPQSEEEQDIKNEDQYKANGQKMTDEEKRKNFLERNRVAALKCRQRKKQWLANLQSKVEMFSQENDDLSRQIQVLRDEVVALKTMLLAHKDCPVTQSQGIANGYLQNMQMGYHSGQDPQGMASQYMPNPAMMRQDAAQMQQQQQQQSMGVQNGMGRRFSPNNPNGAVYTNGHIYASASPQMNGLPNGHPQTNGVNGHAQTNGINGHSRAQQQSNGQIPSPSGSQEDEFDPNHPVNGVNRTPLHQTQ